MIFKFFNLWQSSGDFDFQDVPKSECSETFLGIQFPHIYMYNNKHQ